MGSNKNEGKPETKYFVRSFKKKSCPEGGGNKVMSNNVRYCRSSKIMRLPCFGEEKVRFDKWFSAASQGKTSDTTGQIVDGRRGHHTKRIADPTGSVTLKEVHSIGGLLRPRQSLVFFLIRERRYIGEKKYKRGNN